jgi:NADH:ubiquinone oxidoreductase subunit 6 (subunit J)
MSEIILGLLAAAGALYAISARQLMRGILGLALFFISIAGLFAGMGAWYLAAGQLFLFVGGVVTLFVLAFNFTKTPLYAGKSITAAFVCMIVLAIASTFLSAIAPVDVPSIVGFGTVFFTQYGWVLNAALLLLFAALIGAQYLLEDAS